MKLLLTKKQSADCLSPLLVSLALIAGAVAVAPAAAANGQLLTSAPMTKLSAPKMPSPVKVASNLCGWASETFVKRGPTDGLCAGRLASAANGTEPWTWACRGANTTAGFQAANSSRRFDPVAAGYKLVFDDEFDIFNGNAEGTNGWQTQYAYHSRTLPKTGEIEYYSDASVGVNPFSIRDGALDIAAVPCTNPLTLPYCSGVITSYKTFYVKYGYFETRAQLPAGQGLWAGFWLVNENRMWPPEIDIFEFLGHTPTIMYSSIHDKINEEVVGKTTPITVADSSVAFHIYGMDWEPSSITYYYDGQPVLSYATPSDMTNPMYIIANLAVGGPNSWPGAPNTSTGFPAHMYIDYIRAYASPDSTEMGGSLAGVIPSP